MSARGDREFAGGKTIDDVVTYSYAIRKAGVVAVMLCRCCTQPVDGVRCVNPNVLKIRCANMH